MELRRLSLTNFRGLTNATLDFSPGINLIVGVNGAGKTAVLDALRTLLVRALPEVAVVSNLPSIGLSMDDITVGREQTFIQLDLAVRGQNHSIALSEQKEVIRDAIDANKGLIDIRDVDSLPRLRHGERPMRGDPRLEGTLRGQTSTRPETLGVLEPRPVRSQRNLKPQPLVLYFSVRRAIANRRTPRVTGNPAYQGIFDIERGLELVRLEEWWRGRVQLATEAPDSKSATQLSVVISAFGRLLPHLSDWRVEDSLLTVVKFAEVERINDKGEQEIVQEPRRLPISFLSDGERSLIAIGADIAVRLSLLNDHFDSPLDDGVGVVLIDELDLHLHPQWQRTIVESLRTAFPRIQFICTTHSLFLIQGQRMGNLIRLDSIGEEEEPAEQYHFKSIEDIAEEVQGVDLPQRSQRHVEMMKVASAYYRALRDAEKKQDINLEELKRELDALSVRFSTDPFFAANLDFKWETFLAKQKHETDK